MTVKQNLSLFVPVVSCYLTYQSMEPRLLRTKEIVLLRPNGTACNKEVPFVLRILLF